jgi:6-phosphofructokinase 1
MMKGKLITTLGILTSGGDAPGMNTCIYWLNRFAEERGWKTLGIQEGFVGLLRADATELRTTETLKRARFGSTMLGSSRLKDFPEHAKKLKQSLIHLEINNLAVIGGNGSLTAAKFLVSDACSVVGIPGTIDNNVADCEESLGFDTAVTTAVRLVDGIRDAGEAIPHVFALEVLGGNDGQLAHAVAEASGADVLLIPERPLSVETITNKVKQAMATHRYAIMITCEGYPGSDTIIEQVSAKVGKTKRFGRIGHAQRGGQPSGRDRKLALEFALKTIEELEQNQSGRVVWQHNRAVFLPYKTHAESTKLYNEPWRIF